MRNRARRHAVTAWILPLLVLGGTCFGADPTGILDTQRTAFCPRVAEGPTVDGRLDDACWKQAEAAGRFFLLGNPGQARGQTEVMCARDDKALYVAYRCHADDLDRRKGAERRRDRQVWVDDCVELFVLPAQKPNGVARFQFIVNTLGTIYDSRSDSNARAWNSDGTFAVGTKRVKGAAGYWAVEIAIPFKDLGRTPKEGDAWRVNFCRTSSQYAELSTWSPMMKGGFDQPARFGRLVMRAPTKADLAARAAYAKLLEGKDAATPKRGEYAIPLTVDGAVVFKKVPVADCRILKAFAGDPVDGTIRSMPYVGFTPREYPSRGIGAGVSYHYNNNDGLHLTLADREGFDAVVLRGFARTGMYADATQVAGPGTGRRLHDFTGVRALEVASFKERVKTHRISFFKTDRGAIADLAFYRIEKPDALPGKGELWTCGPDDLSLPQPKNKFAPESVLRGMEERYSARERRTMSLAPGKAGGGPIALEKDVPVHFLSAPFASERGLAAVGLEARVAGKAPLHCTFVVHDPLNPRRSLTWLRLSVDKAGVLRPIADFPDQVLLKDTRLWVTLRFDRDVKLSGPDGDAPALRMHFVPRAAALPEAIAYRRFLMRTLFGPVSEPRPWGRLRRGITRQEFFAKYKYTERLPEFFMTIEQCRAIDPTDDLSRQYHEWVFAEEMNRKLSAVPLPPPPPDGAPDWAWYPRLAWLEARRIADWWMEERMVPTGEVGVGGIQDDGDLYQQFADLPFFETGGVAAKVLDCGARIAELAERDHLKGGLNKRATDALHAYEEGINHLALMARWFYGDPIYLERCMESARNMEKLTVVTDDGRRHFRSHQRMGYEDVTHPREPEIDGSSTALMWHTALQAADYNHNPRALKTLGEWADSWLRLMKPPDWATAIEVKTGKVVGSSKDRPLYGGYRSQAVTHVWLHALTGEKRYIEPFLYYYRKGKTNSPAGNFLGDVYAAGGLDGLDKAALDKLKGVTAEMAIFTKSDPAPLLQSIIGNPTSSRASVNTLCDARRFPDMYTTAHQYTDRVLLGLIQAHAAKAYLGGYCKRNKYNPTHAVSWEGFGTDLGALVLRNRRNGAKVAAYNFSTTTRQGAMRVWALEHGEYRVTVGIDDDRDFKIDRQVSRTQTELVRAGRIHLPLRPRVVTLVEIEQVRKLDPVRKRADLAIAAREVEIKGNTLSGTVHNIGSANATDVQVAVLDAYGRPVSRKSLGRLDAPLDLMARRKTFTLALPNGSRKGWKLALDPDGRIPEIYEGNNVVELDALPAVDYRKGWE